jgi:hypothetical protein
MLYATPLFIYVSTLYTLQAGVGRPPRDLTDLLQDMMTAEVTGSSDLKENKAENTASVMNTVQSRNFTYCMKPVKVQSTYL